MSFVAFATPIYARVRARLAQAVVRDDMRTRTLSRTSVGHDTCCVFKTGKHGDLVTALGLATQAPPPAVYVY